MTIRRAEKAGSWYPADSAALTQLLDACLATADTEAISADQRPVAAIVPHAGLAFSGPCAAKGFAALQAAKPETLLLFGAVHTQALTEAVIWPDGAWDSPLGQVAVDDELAAELVRAGVGVAGTDPHVGDNALELQIPFIRHGFPEARIVPIAVPPQVGIEQIGRRAWEVAQASDRRIVAVGSTDLTHYGRAFGVFSAGAGDAALAWTEENDRRLLDQVCALEAEQIVFTASRDHSACGAGALAATVAWAKAAGARASLLEHTNSHAVRPEGVAEHFVGYASVLFSCSASR